MFFRSFFDENLAQISYLVGCQRTGDAIVIDPARKVSPYVKTAKKNGLKIIASAETHIHADFISGSKELAEQCNAAIFISDEGDWNWKYAQESDFTYELLTDGSIFHIGLIEFDIMHTPGHTPESISFILTDKGAGAAKPMGIFTGDFVFVGDVGRPDLLEKSVGLQGTAEHGAREMFHSLQKFKQLPAFLQVWPGHGAGSACGKSLGAVPMSTVGYERLYNWALKETSEDHFVKELVSGQSIPPNYFAMMKKLNKRGPALIKKEKAKKLINIEKLGGNVILLDTRPAKEFAKAHVPGSINIPLNQSFTNWAGELINYDQDIVLIVQEKDIERVKENLYAIGLDRIVAFMEPSLILERQVLTESYGEVTVELVHDLVHDDQFHLIDVRTKPEWDEGRIEGADHKTLSQLSNLLDDLPKDKTYLVQCRSGARSAIAASILQANGYKAVKNVKGGYLAWLKEKYPVKA